MAWWYEIRGDENRLVELRRGFVSEQEAREAAERALEAIKAAVYPKETETVRIVTGADPERTEGGKQGVKIRVSHCHQVISS